MIGTRTEWSQSDERYMRRALELARLGLGLTSPNPVVGAVIVKNGRVLGEGWHREFGSDHAEVHAFKHLRDPDEARGATLYVTLEPCCHHGKTPPCTDAILRQGISRVVVSHLDDYAEVSGRGAHILRDHGVRVEIGLLQTEATRLNAGFLMHNRHHRPFITAKWAMTLDGRIAATSGDSKWISSEPSRRFVHELRAQTDAVLVGIGTILNDNPRLNVRMEGYTGRQPRRVIVDSHLRTPFKAALFEAEPAGGVVIVTCALAKEDVVQRFRDNGVEVLTCPHAHGMIDMRVAMAELARLGIQTVLVEGGSQVNGTLFKSGLIDEVHAFIAPKIIGGDDRTRTPIQGFAGENMRDALALADARIHVFGPDICVSGYVVKPDALEGLYAATASGERAQVLHHHEGGA